MLKHLQVQHAETFTGTTCWNVYRYTMLKRLQVHHA